MSVMYCPICERDVDTDFEEYDFDNDCCDECYGKSVLFGYHQGKFRGPESEVKE